MGSPLGKHIVHHTHTAGIGHELRAVAKQTTGGYFEDHAGHLVFHLHI